LSAGAHHEGSIELQASEAIRVERLVADLRLDPCGGEWRGIAEDVVNGGADLPRAYVPYQNKDSL